jgi:NADPH:quinone reductase-like Zn-dependent oxidoreductase
MKAIVYHKYGSPDELKLTEVDKPTPGDQEVLVKIKAVSINASDYEFLTGSPLYTRMWGLFKPKYRILGSDIAGIVEAVGSNVKKFEPGDEVFGDVLGFWGGFAEFVCAREDSLVFKPESMTFNEAAAVPQAAVSAMQGLRDKGKIRPGQNVLINGGGGGAGSFAVQLAKHFKANVTGVDSTTKLEMMLSCGADHVIDYTFEDFTQNGKHYDLILDFVASHSIFDYKRALSPGGKYLMVGGSMAALFRTLILGSLISLTRDRKMGILAVIPNRNLSELIKLLESGSIGPKIDRLYPLSEVAEAMRYVGEGHARGKVVITL